MGALRLSLAVVILAGSVAAGHAADIVSLFRELQVAQPNGFPRYDLHAGRKGVTATGGALYGPRARILATVDTANGYLRLDDLGDGDGASSFTTEFALWLDADGAPLVGLSERGIAKGSNVPFAGRVRFYSRASGRWNLVNREVWPSLDTTLCGTPDEEVAEDTAAWEALGRAVTLLPRKGTTVAVWCVPPSPGAGRGMALEWDRASGRFRTAGTLSGSPAWTPLPAPHPSDPAAAPE